MTDLRPLSRILARVLGFDGCRTLSAELGRRIEAGTATELEEELCEVLDFFFGEEDHCGEAAEREDE